MQQNFSIILYAINCSAVFGKCMLSVHMVCVHWNSSLTIVKCRECDLEIRWCLYHFQLPCLEEELNWWFGPFLSSCSNQGLPLSAMYRYDSCGDMKENWNWRDAWVGVLSYRLRNDSMLSSVLPLVSPLFNALSRQTCRKCVWLKICNYYY